MKERLNHVRLKISPFIQPQKIFNYLRLYWDIRNGSVTPKSYPIDLHLSLSNTCNASCRICSINNIKKRKIPRTINNISFNQIVLFHELFERAFKVDFMGLIGESLLNPHFEKIIRYLKQVHHLKLSMSTNGLGLNHNLQDTMLDIRFDSVIFSIHAARPETYSLLQGIDFNVVLMNLSRLAKERNRRNLVNPNISIAFALNKANISETPEMLHIAMTLKLNHLWLYHYRDYGFQEISLEKEPEYANHIIDKLYASAKALGAIYLLPPNPPYFQKNDALKSVKLNETDSQEKCYLPWKSFQMKASYSHHNSYYLSCCNTLNLFLLNYTQYLDAYGSICFKRIWHHPILQYLRETVNPTDHSERNPICKYCKSSQRNFLKNTDNKENYTLKLKYIKEFFDGFPPRYKALPEITGLEVLYREDEELNAMAG